MVDRGTLDMMRHHDFIDPRVRSQAPDEKMAPLSPAFNPGNWDVISMMGRESYEHVGNRRFRICIDNNVRSYTGANSKQLRSAIVTNIVESIRGSSTQAGGGFVRQDLESGLWYEVGGKAARDKVGQALRDAMKVLKKRDSVEQTGDDINLRTNKIILKKRPYVEQTEDDINPRSNKKICGVSERSIVVDTPNKKYASGLSRSDCSSMQYKQPSTPIFESLVGVSALEEIATKNRTSCADYEQEIKNDEEGEVTDLLQHLPSSSPLLCTKEQQVPYSGMVTVVSDSVKGRKKLTIGSCSFHIEAVAFNTTATSSVWSKDLSEITLQTSSSAKHHHQEESCQKNAIIYSENVFLDPFEEDLEPVPLGPSRVVLGTSALLVAPSGPRCPSIHEKLFLGSGFPPMMSRAPASVLTHCGDDRTTSPLASFLLAKRNGYNEAVAIMNDNLRPLDHFSTFV